VYVTHGSHDHQRGEERLRVFPPATRLIFRNQVIHPVPAAILHGRLQPGQPITKRPLAHDLQISRTPVSDEDVLELYSLRANLETIRVDLALHRRICEIAAHRRLLDAWGVLANQLRALHTITDVPMLVTSLYACVDQMGAPHRPMVDAIRH